jgi:hypothetical protein
MFTEKAPPLGDLGRLGVEDQAIEIEYESFHFSANKGNIIPILPSIIDCAARSWYPPACVTGDRGGYGSQFCPRRDPPFAGEMRMTWTIGGLPRRIGCGGFSGPSLEREGSQVQALRFSLSSGFSREHSLASAYGTSMRSV